MFLLPLPASTTLWVGWELFAWTGAVVVNLQSWRARVQQWFLHTIISKELEPATKEQWLSLYCKEVNFWFRKWAFVSASALYAKGTHSSLSSNPSLLATRGRLTAREPSVSHPISKLSLNPPLAYYYFCLARATPIHMCCPYLIVEIPAVCTQPQH